ncbi:3-beta hydroxysteroid dehydrogenase [Mycolicibacter terrae]|uniref:3-beta hydroxysteroid dehydrogenase n=1 Tax=Mycolicibacter terrae TaxID=1788 RepID=A0AAD1MJN3_9MYCO|nr:SDR family oxidoreductase [Mycolicibacter terrae]ORW93519.1 3-beta hydroxysteroid dehydrogenase [Mycolicibacter terrae]BBX24385.1 3-beta hydroxysteroid dehydrogenase [Mycolicibacter terrae]SNV53968.1 Oxidoreductase [Mycolicibacter terrae]
MRIFITGASGGIGTAVVSELIAAGHQALGLARSEASAGLIRRLGAEAVSGDLADTDMLKRVADDADGVIHLAFSNDFTNLEAGIQAEARAIAAVGEVLVGTGKPLILAAGTPTVAGRPSTEEDPPQTEGPVGGRGRTSQAVVKLAEHGVRSALVRLPRSVHEAGGRCGFASMLIASARRTGVSGYVGDGGQRWPAVHRLDAARLFRIAVEEAPAGSILHAVADQGDPMREIAEVIGSRLRLPVQPVAAESYGVLGAIFAVDQPSSSALTRKRFGWQPSHPSLLADLSAGGYPDL